MTVNEKTAAEVLSTVMKLKPTEQQLQRFAEIHHMIDEVPKFGNAIDDVDYFARDVAYTYTKTSRRNIPNPRGGHFQAGLYPVSANVPLGATDRRDTGRTVMAHTPVADGVSPSAGKDVHGPTAAANFGIQTGPLVSYPMEHCSTRNSIRQHLPEEQGLEKFVALIRSYFDQKGMHMQFNVVDRETLLDAQKHPEKYAASGCAGCRIQRIVYNTFQFSSG